MKILIGLVLTFSLLAMTAAETYVFGSPANPEKAEVSVKDGDYLVVCTFKTATGNSRNTNRLNLLKAQKICLLGIASFRKGKKVRRCSASVQGLTLVEKPKKNGDTLTVVYRVPVNGFMEKQSDPAE